MPERGPSGTGHDTPAWKMWAYETGQPPVAVPGPASVSPAEPPHYEAVIKVNIRDEAGKRARDIADGIGYAICLLQDEYGWSVNEIECAVEPHLESAFDREQDRAR